MERDLPTGTVTFLFTDMEGSTKLLQRLGREYPRVLEEHQHLIREALRAHDGVEVSTEGDSFFAVFASAPQAVSAAVAAQRAIAAHTWPEDGAVRVRMGIHTGEGTRGADDYVGADVHRGSRIAAAAHGGQIVVSEPTRALAEDVEGVSFRDLGEHRLKDLDRPERISQVVADGLERKFPMLRSADARPNNLPGELTSFVGRRKQLDEVRTSLRETRLLTLTGPGGTGKTRLALHSAAELLPEFEDGVFFVALAPISDPNLVVPTIAEVLGLMEEAERTPVETVVEEVGDRRLLLVLDNLEQVVDAAPDIAKVLEGTRDLRIIVTSREPLGIRGERELPVPPLGLPDPSGVTSAEALTGFEGVALFAERARAVAPDFEITDANAAAVAEICTSLDGLPLAIELAAARVKILTPEAMVQRLADRLGFLRSASRDVPTRQRTLRDAIAWSFDLLGGDERTLFCRLSVFVGGFDLSAVETVCNPGDELGGDTFEGLASLLNKSLIRRQEGRVEARFLMLETIREFASECLADSADAAAVGGRHTAYFSKLAADSAPLVFGPTQKEVLDALAVEHDNLRAAIDRQVASGDLPGALRIASYLWRFWQMRGHLREGRDRLERLLAEPASRDDPATAADALEALGGIRYWMGDLLAAREMYHECLTLRRELDDARGVAEALYNEGFTYSTRLSREQRQEGGRALLEEALGIFRDLDDEGGVARVLWGLGNMAYEDMDYERGERLFREALDIHERQGDPFGMAWDKFELGLTLQRMARPSEAREMLEESLKHLADSGDATGITLVLGGLSALATQAGDGERAAILYGAATALENAVGGGLTRLNEEWEGWGEGGETLLGPDEARRAREVGSRMSADEAVAFALGDSESGG